MTPAQARTPPAAALCEMLLRRYPGCAWVLQRDGAFHAVYGDAPRVFGRSATELQKLNFADLFEPPARASWMGSLQRVFAGETMHAASRFGACARFSITLFPLESPEGEMSLAGGLAHAMPDGGRVLSTLEALESQRAQLSQLLHDSIGQNLSAAGLQLDLLRMDLAQSDFPISQRVGQIQAMLEASMALVRDVNRGLHPAGAERVGLRAALDRLAGRLRADFKGNVRVLADAKAQPGPQAAAALFRIADEAASLATRRTGCSVIQILLKSLRSGPALEVRDNGAGFTVAEGACQEGWLEFLVMRHFAEGAGIELQIDSAPDRGTVIRAICRRV